MEATEAMFKPVPARLQTLIEQILALSVLLTLWLYIFTLWVQLPYRGFDWDSSTGRVVRIYVEGGLQPEDRLLQIGPISAADFQNDLRLTLLNDARPGQTTPLVVQRGNRQFTLNWRLPGFNREEFIQGRLQNQWWLALLFWGIGELTLLSVRPKGARQRLLAAFNFLLALWLGASLLSGWHMRGSAILLRMVAWLIAPVILHLHWVFPEPLRPLSAWVWRSFYLSGVTLAGFEWLQALPTQTYALGVIFATTGSLILLAIHFVFRPAQRRDLTLLLATGGLTFLPPLGLGIMTVLSIPVSVNNASVLLFLPVLPLGYFYIAYRRQLGGLELRANRLIAIYIFLAVVGLIVAIANGLINAFLTLEGRDFLADFAVPVLAAGAALFAFPRFQRFVERRWLGIPRAPVRLLETYARRVVTTLDVPGLVQLLTDKVLPSLLVRQFAFLSLDDDNRSTLLCAWGVKAEQVPGDREAPALLARAGTYHPPDLADEAPEALAWIRLVLSLRLGGRPIGLWLLGRRDPDDFYSQAEIPTFQALADQTAIALSHIQQAERLRAVYQADIDRHEAERTRLARELHDDVLGQLAMLAMVAGEHTLAPRFHEAYQTLTGRLRQTITGLRPAMLDYGLRPALCQLADELAERTDDQVSVLVEAPEGDARYPAHVEQHLYRIVQQACENALKHGRPQTIRIYGQLEDGQVDLTVEDDGVGFPISVQPDLARLLAHKHFGLVGMYERAALIRAAIQLDSSPGRGTRVRVAWNADSRA